MVVGIILILPFAKNFQSLLIAMSPFLIRNDKCVHKPDSLRIPQRKLQEGV